jgi:YVTN family beta-propeller protein
MRGLVEKGNGTCSAQTAARFDRRRRRDADERRPLEARRRAASIVRGRSRPPVRRRIVTLDCRAKRGMRRDIGTKSTAARWLRRGPLRPQGSHRSEMSFEDRIGRHWNMSDRRALWAAALTCVVAAFVAGCGGGGGGGASDQMIIVQGISPTDGEELPTTPDATLNQNVIVTFSGPPRFETVLDPADQVSGLSANVRIRDHRSQRVSGVPFLGGRDPQGRTVQERQPNANAALVNLLSHDSPSILRFVADSDGDLNTIETFKIDQTLTPPAEQISVEVTRGVTNGSGEPLLQGFCSSFSVGQDHIRPTVVLSDPPNNATNVSTSSPITFRFNESMDPATVRIGTEIQVRATAIQGTTPVSRPIAGAITQPNPNDTCTYVFTPSQNYPGSPSTGSTVVSLVINTTTTGATGPKDMAGNVVGDANGATLPFPPGLVISFTTTPVPNFPNNPAVPEVVFYGRTTSNAPGVGAIASEQVITVPGRTLLGDINGDGVMDSRDNNIQVPNSFVSNVGFPSDMVVGPFITSTPPAPLQAQMAQIPPIPNPPAEQPIFSTATTLPSVCGLPFVAIPNNTNADIGNFLYISDQANHLVHVLNSQNMQEVTTIATPDPTGLAEAADLTFLFVTNFGTDQVSVIDTRPTSNTFHQVIRTIPVGAGPRGISSQPSGEDVIVCNSLGNSLSIISLTNGFTVRKTISNNLIGPDPVDIAITYRTPPFVAGGTGTYLGYVVNHGGNSISIFESGPDFPFIIGPDDIRFRLDDSSTAHIRQPNSVSWDTGFGAWYLNGEDGTVGHADLTFIGPPPNPYFPNPAPNRVFGVRTLTPAFGPGANDLTLGNNFTLCACVTNTKSLFNCNGILNINPPIRAYLAMGSGEVIVFDPSSADLTPLARIPTGGASIVTTYFEQ